MPDPAPTTGFLTKDALRAQIRRFLDDDPADDDNLVDLGLTSIAAMELVTAWKALGLDVGFLELARCATLDALWSCLADKASGAPVAGQVAGQGAGQVAGQGASQGAGAA
jgi:aryl carrier-like protein